MAKKTYTVLPQLKMEFSAVGDSVDPTEESPMRKPRRHFTAEEKLAILRRHLMEQVPVSQLCDEHGIQPTVFYRWQKDLFENGSAALERKNGRREGRERDAQAQRIQALEAKLARKDEVLAELMEEHVFLKKSLGEI